MTIRRGDVTWARCTVVAATVLASAPAFAQEPTGQPSPASALDTPGPTPPTVTAERQAPSPDEPLLPIAPTSPVIPDAPLVGGPPADNLLLLELDTAERALIEGRLDEARTRAQSALSRTPPQALVAERARTILRLIDLAITHRDRRAESDALEARGPDDFEMAEFYSTGALTGLGAGLWLTLVADLEDPQEFVPLLTVGAGLGILGVYGLDHALELRAGLPSAISAGLTLGLGEGVLIAAQELDFFDGSDDADYANLIMVTTAFGGVGGALLGYALEPSVGDTSLVRSGALWGLISSLMFAFALDLEGDDDAFFVTTMLGYNAGIVGGALLTKVLDVTRGRALLIDLGGVGGLLFGLSASVTLDVDEQPAAAITGLSTLAGLAIATLITEPRPEAVAPRANDEVDMTFFAAPRERGGLLGVMGSF